jgi:hypothetical protein
MYSKDEASRLKQTFWTAFGQYISPHPSAEGLRINWINYKTGIKHLHFKMHADNRSAFIGIEISYPDPGMQELLFEQFIAYQKILESSMGEVWEWQLHISDENHKIVSRISKSLPAVSIFKTEDWPALISFFKPRIIGLDEFWSDAHYGFGLFK